MKRFGLGVVLTMTMVTGSWGCAQSSMTPGSTGQVAADAEASDSGDTEVGPETTPDVPMVPDVPTMPDVPTTPDVPAEVVAPDPCDARCGGFSGCENPAVEAACRATCADDEAWACEIACIAVDPTGENCSYATACLGVTQPGTAAFDPGPYSTMWRDGTADDFTVPTLDGDGSFNLQEHVDGSDSYVFLMHQTGIEWSQQLWFDSSVFSWLSTSPPNVHYFFMVYASAAGDDSATHLAAMQDRVEEGLAKIAVTQGKIGECHWRRRIHYVPGNAWDLGGWLGQMLQDRPVLGWAIDRFQKLRQLGLLSLVQGPPLLQHAGYAPAHYNFEWQREQDLVKEDVTVVRILDEEKVGAKAWEVELPSAEEMAGFDTVLLDIRQMCEDHDHANCHEWDRKAWVDVRETPVEAVNPDAETACQGRVDEVVEVLEVLEVLGTCTGDVSVTCSAETDCDMVGGPCDGYVAPVAPVAPVVGVDADTLPCECYVPAGTGDSATRETTKTCRDDGTGYDECLCNDSWEFGRWITTYNREGRWIQDLSPLLPLIARGGRTRFYYKAGEPYIGTLELRLYNAGKAQRPVTLTKMWGGGGFGPNVNDNRPSMQFAIPAQTTRTEIWMYTTGHGFGGDFANCAEFCNHTHHFFPGGFDLNDAYVHDHKPWIDNYYGCADQLHLGAVPNQFGTWTIGRGGWCPGMDVVPYNPDISASVTPGETLEMDYRVYLDYLPGEAWSEPFGGSLWTTQYLITYE